MDARGRVPLKRGYLDFDEKIVGKFFPRFQCAKGDIYWRLIRRLRIRSTAQGTGKEF